MYSQRNAYAIIRQAVFLCISVAILLGCFSLTAVAEELYDDVSDGIENTEKIDTADVSIIHSKFGDPAYYGLTITDSYAGNYFTNNGEINISSDKTDYVIGVNNMSSATFLENGASVTVNVNPFAEYARGIGIYSSGSMENKSNVRVIAEGGADASASDSDGNVCGIWAEGDVTNRGVITATATAGTASADGIANSNGIYSTGTIINESESVTAVATGGTVVITDASSASNAAFSYGLYSHEAATSTGGVVLSIATGGIASGGTYADSIAYAKGINSKDSINNTSTVTVTTEGGTASGSDYAGATARSWGLDASSDVTNTSVITVSAKGGTIVGDTVGYAYARSYGISADGSVDNSGAIIVTAVGGTSSVTFLSHIYGKVYGIKAQSGNVVNSGAITVTATGGTALNHSIMNDEAYAYGIYLEADLLINSGDIIATATAGSLADAGEAYAYGLYSEGEVDNSGAITVAANGGTSSFYDAVIQAYGIYNEENDLVNTGAITATATAGSLATGGSAQAYGIYSNGSVSNSGAITVSAADGTGSENSSVSAFGIYAQGDVDNSAAMTVSAVAGDAATDTMDVTAHGIVFAGASYSLDSTGLISVSAENISIGAGGTQEAYQVYVQDGDLSINSYAMEFEGAQENVNAVYSGTIKHQNDPDNITFNDATLYAYTPEAINKTYDIPTLVEGAGVSNQFASVIAVHPDVEASLIDGGAGENQQIQFSYEPEVSSALVGVQATQTVAARVNSTVLSQLLSTSTRQDVYSASLDAKQQNYSNTAAATVDSRFSKMVASLSDVPDVAKANEALVEESNIVFVKPVYVYSAKNDSGYSSNSYGLVAGYTRRMEGDWYLGAHGGYTYTDVNYLGDGYTDREEEIKTGYAGLHGGGVFDDRWVISAVSSFFYGKYYFRDSNPSYRETAKHDALTVRTSLTGGYIIPTGKHRFLPELGLTHTWQHSDSYSSEPEEGTKTVYSTLDNHELYGSARLSWYYRYEMDSGWVVFPSLGVGVTQLLTDGKITNTLSLGSASQLVVDEEDYTTFTPFCSFTAEKDGYFMTFAYEGGFSDRVQNTLLSLQVGMGF